MFKVKYEYIQVTTAIIFYKYTIIKHIYAIVKTKICQ